MTALLLGAIHVAGVRAIISRGWSNLGSDALNNKPNVFWLGDCPHKWLFQHFSALVHHGGAGTAAFGLLHGKTTTIVPFFGESICHLYENREVMADDEQSTLLG
ncbi:hypothetical protein JOL62DRAFT_587253 [Phyllosticta paracitricarpa]|uniref:Glucosyltransferase n=1 Tax=Phyllosticta paracitricarpa TaxID=2016321 RepID=A0ABR1MTV5_9PEZI